MRFERLNASRKLRVFSGLALVVALLGAGFLGMSATAGENKEAGNASDELAEKFGGQVSNILDESDKWVGKTVTISNGEIGEVVSDRAFVLESGVAGTGAGLLVISSKKFPEASNQPGGVFQKDNDVKVTGVVRMFNAPEIEKEIGWDVEDRWEKAYDKKPVLVATDVMLVEEE